MIADLLEYLRLQDDNDDSEAADSGTVVKRVLADLPVVRCRKLIQHNGDRIWVGAVEAPGCCVGFTLPAVT